MPSRLAAEAGPATVRLAAVPRATAPAAPSSVRREMGLVMRGSLSLGRQLTVRGWTERRTWDQPASSTAPSPVRSVPTESYGFWSW